MCLGDGHDGVWNIVAEFATFETRWEIQGLVSPQRKLHSLSEDRARRLRQAESWLWQGDVEAAMALFADCPRKQARNFCAYLAKHRARIVNYA